MSIITTKQLRENMSQVINDLKQGRSVQLSYRHKVIGILQPVDGSQPSLRRGSPEAVRRGLLSLQGLEVPKATRNDSRSIKDQITDIRTKKYDR